MSLSIRRLKSEAPDFSKVLDDLIAWEDVSDTSVQSSVAEILQNVRSRGDAALVEYSNRFDRRDLQSAAELVVSAEQIEKACENFLQHLKRLLRALGIFTVVNYSPPGLIGIPTEICSASRYHP